MRGQAGIFLIIGILAVAFLGFVYYMGFFNTRKSPAAQPSPQSAGGYQTLSEDPKYQEVKEKYNLSEEQLQILSTVNPEDNE